MKGKRNVPSVEGSKPHIEYSLWTAPRSAWSTPFQLDQVIPNLDVFFDSLGLTEIPEDERIAAFRTPVTSDVLSQPTQNHDGSTWRVRD